jgi:hypothetical protein
MPAPVGGHHFDVTSTDGVAGLEAYVQRRLGGQVRDFRLEVAHQGLVLKGRARTYYAKQLAQHAVMNVARLRVWANEIEVS